MNQEKKLKEYCELMLLNIEIEDEILVLNEKEYFIIDSERELFDEELNFLPVSEYDVDGFVYEFGGRWYIHEKGEEVKLTELKYFNKALGKLPTNSFLGIRTGYELRNGMGLYKDWISKAKFLGCKTLGICERSTLSGALLFQGECQRNDIKPVIGMTIPVQGIEQFDIKIYAKNFRGWSKLLKFSAILNVDEEHSIAKEFLEKNSDGCFVVADPKSMNFEDMPSNVDFYQLETVKFLNPDKDAWFINNLEKFIKSDISPIAITDAFYLEQGDYITREYLWAIAKAFDDKTDNQYFKNKDQYAKELIQMFESTDKSWIKLFKEAIANEELVAQNCNFKYDTDTRHLPKYVMTEEESDQFETNEKLFLHLIKKGFKDRGITDSKYVDRIKEEIRVLKRGDVIDYFLVLHDIIGYAKKEKLLTGIGRGSAGGSLVSYLLGLIQIDPMEFDLLFERFLNDGRMGEFVDRPSFKITLENEEEIELIEGTLVRIINLAGVEEVVFVHDLQIGDDILKY